MRYQAIQRTKKKRKKKMKKLMFAAVALTAGFAMAETVESDQIVGYVQAGKAEASQYVPLATQFEALGGGDIAVKNAVTVENAVASNTAAGDQLWRWDTATATWTKYAYYKKPRTDPAEIFWTKIVNDKAEGTETTDTIPAGETFFFKRSSGATEAATLTLAGGVKDLSGESSFAVTQNQLAFVANPWPTEIVIKDFNQFVTEGTPSASNTAAGDQIWLWDTANGTWVKYCLHKDSRAGITDNWRKIVGTKPDTKETEDTIPAGKGIFFQRSGLASPTEPLKVTFTLPITK